MNGVTIHQGDVREVLPRLESQSVNCVVTSPPYWGLRDYGCEGQLGLERTPEEYIANMVGVFREVKRVLRDDGTLWLNMGDSYASTGGHSDSACNDRRGSYNIGTRLEHEHREFRVRGGKDCDPKRGIAAVGQTIRQTGAAGLKPKDLCGIPWMLAFALRADGWYLRQDIIWSKPNPMPESVTDRCTKAHEYMFLLSKSERYYFDADTIRENWTCDRDDMREKGVRTGTAYLQQAANAYSNSVKPVAVPSSYKGSVPGRNGGPGQERRSDNARKVKIPGGWDRGEGAHGTIHRDGRTEAEYADVDVKDGRNKRSVWTVATQPFPEAHFATFPEELIKPCILAGCPAGGTVLDPFGGSGTTALVARDNNCKAVLIELSADYIEITKRRLSQEVLDFSSTEG